MSRHTCDDCTRCAGCSKRVCFAEHPSPGEIDGLCVGCWSIDDPETGDAA